MERSSSVLPALVGGLVASAATAGILLLAGDSRSAPAEREVPVTLDTSSLEGLLREVVERLDALETLPATTAVAARPERVAIGSGDEEEALRSLAEELAALRRELGRSAPDASGSPTVHALQETCPLDAAALGVLIAGLGPENEGEERFQESIRLRPLRELVNRFGTPTSLRPTDKGTLTCYWHSEGQGGLEVTVYDGIVLESGIWVD